MTSFSYTPPTDRSVTFPDGFVGSSNGRLPGGGRSS